MTVASRARLRRSGITALEICAVGALYYASGRLGLLQQLVGGRVTPLWPPTGVALAGLLLLGPRIWPGIALGTFLINISLGPSVPAVLAITAGNTLAPLCACALLRRAGFRTEMNRLRDVLGLVVLGAFTGMLISATVGSGALHLAGALPANQFWLTWWVWWAGDAMGVLMVTPVLLVLRSASRPKGVPRSRWVEGAALVAATVAVGFLQISPAPLIFLAFPVLVWAAFRFQRSGAAPCALALSIFAIVAAARRTGPFTGHDLLVNMIALQAFNSAAALTALSLAAAITERNLAHEKIEQACRRLAELAAQTAPEVSGPLTLGNDSRDDHRKTAADGPDDRDHSAASPPYGRRRR
ncbi:MASE1 domain-containing protein [Streptomyces shenzhenensis]|uniref:MASE1 domain-containing protein n=1 Tax=Streptomyces shenzhenensis TaxID=943815 RepID=UPI003D8DDCF8